MEHYEPLLAYCRLRAALAGQFLNSGLRLGWRNRHGNPLRRVGFNAFPLKRSLITSSNCSGVQLAFCNALSAPIAAASCIRLVMVMRALVRMTTGIAFKAEWNGYI